jgi:hypothetical protein
MLDGLLQFTGTAGSAAAMTDSPTTGTQQSTNVLDLLNARDLGIGDDPSLELLIQIMTTFTGGTSLQVQLQGAPDNGSGSPGTYTTMWDSGAIAEASLVAGRYLLAGAFPRTLLANPDRPKFGSSPPAFPPSPIRYGRNAWCGCVGWLHRIGSPGSNRVPPGIVIAN